MRESQKKLLTPEVALEDIKAVKAQRYKDVEKVVLICAAVLVITCLISKNLLLILMVAAAVLIGIVVVRRKARNLKYLSPDQVIIEEDAYVGESAESNSEGLPDRYAHFKSGRKVQKSSVGAMDLLTGLGHMKPGDKFYTTRLAGERVEKYYPCTSWRIREVTEEEIAEEEAEEAREQEEMALREPELLRTLLNLEPDAMLTMRRDNTKDFKPGEDYVSADKPEAEQTLVEKLALARFDGDLVSAVELILRYAPTEPLNQAVMAFNKRESNIFLRIYLSLKLSKK